MENGKSFYGLFIAISDAMIEAEPVLTELDSAIGDGDCGQGLKTGFTRVKNDLAGMENETAAVILKKVAMAMIQGIGGTSGAIYGTFFTRAANYVGKQATGDTNKDIEGCLLAGLEGAKMRGENTQVGDKTMIDALEPAVFTFNEALEAGKSINEAIKEAAVAAEKGSDSTIDMVAKKGRASYTGERSVGHRDAGSWGIVVIAKAVEQYINN